MKDKIRSIKELMEQERAIWQYQRMCNDISELLVQVTKEKRELEKQREKALAPAREITQKVHEEFSEKLAELIVSEHDLKDAMSKLIEESRNVQEQLYNLSLKAQEEGNMDEVSKYTIQRSSATVSLPKNIYIRKLPELEIIDIQQVPKQFLKANRADLLRYLEDQEKDLPWVKVLVKMNIVVRDEDDK